MSAVLLLLTIPAQWLAYTALARYAFRVPTGRACLIGLLRVVAGAAIYWPIQMATVDLSFFATNLFSAPLAWAIAALLDPRRSWRRWLTWVAAGTAVSVVLNLALFTALVGDDYFSSSVPLIPG